jgi:MFS family permease
VKQNIKLIALFNLFTDFDLYSAILVIYFANITGSYILAMSLYSIVMVSSAIFEIPTGVFSDYIGRRKTMIMGAISSIVSVVFYAIGTNYPILIVGALFEGLRRAWYSGNNDALLYEILADNNQKEEYDHYLGKTA